MMHQGPHKDRHHTSFNVKDYPSAYLVDLNINEDEICRILIQDKLVTTMTASLRGFVPEVADLTVLRSVLDVGCGTGFWLRELAQAYPSIEKLIGVDSNRAIVTSARGGDRDTAPGSACGVSRHGCTSDAGVSPIHF